MVIVFGDCLPLGGFRYDIVLLDVATRFCWVFGIQSLASVHIIAALKPFQSKASGVLKTYHSDFNHKLIGGATLRWINKQNKCLIISANAGRQSSNGPVERT